MKLLPFLLALFGLGLLGYPQSRPVAEKLAAVPSPLCECNPCKCVDCKCGDAQSTIATPVVAVATEKIAVEPASPIADTRPTIAPAEAKAVEQVAFTQPQVLPVNEYPSIIDRHTSQISQIQNVVDDTGRTKWIPSQYATTAAKPKAAAQPAKAAAGHYEYRQQCNGRSCQVVRVWVPHQPAKQAAPVVYQQPVYQQQYGSCGPGGCGRVGLFGRRR
jgi:hypothetical protein